MLNQPQLIVVLVVVIIVVFGGYRYYGGPRPEAPVDPLAYGPGPSLYLPSVLGVIAIAVVLYLLLKGGL